MSGVRAVVVLLTLTALLPAAVIHFDDLSGTGAVPDGYGGINWGGDWDHFDFSFPPYNPKSVPQRILPNGQGCEFCEQTFSFVTGDQVFHGAWFAGQPFVTVQFNLYDDNNLVWSSATLTISDVPTFLSSGYSGPVDVIGILSNSEAGFYVMDDVTYGVAAIPEPGTISLLGAGLAAILAGRRVRK
jgi:hypothetical protein